MTERMVGAPLDVLYFPMLDIAYLTFSQCWATGDVVAYLATGGQGMAMGTISLSLGPGIGLEIATASKTLPESMIRTARVAF
jgi:uncharacterized protein YuzE